MTIAVVNYMQFLLRGDGTPFGTNYQNFFLTRKEDFLPFGYGFGGGQSAGDRSQGGLVLPVNEISLNLMQEAMQQRYLLMAKTYAVDEATLIQGALLYQELWTIGGWSHDQVRLTVDLRGPGDAVRSNSLRVLRQELVGSVPSTGQVVVS